MSCYRYDSYEASKWEIEVSKWMEGKTFYIPNPENCIAPPEKEEWNISKLASILVQKGLIPATIENDGNLYTVLLAQMHVQLLRNLVVPVAVTHGNFYRNSEVKGYILGQAYSKQQSGMKELEGSTGVNLNHWYRLKRCETARVRAQPFAESYAKRVSFFILTTVYFLQFSLTTVLYHFV